MASRSRPKLGDLARRNSRKYKRDKLGRFAHTASNAQRARVENRQPGGGPSHTVAENITGVEGLPRPARRAWRDAVDAIAAVHGTDRRLPELPIHAYEGDPTDGVQGAYVYDRLTGEPGYFQLNVHGTALESVIVHELGHMVDSQVLGSQGPFSSTEERGTGQTLGAWWRTTADSEPVRSLSRMLIHNPDRDGPWSQLTLADGRNARWNPESDYAQYLVDPREVFARAYAQWIATESGNAALLRQIRKEVVTSESPSWTLKPGSNPPFYPLQWTDEEFQPIASEMRRIFGDLNLLRS